MTENSCSHLKKYPKQFSETISKMILWGRGLGYMLRMANCNHAVNTISYIGSLV